MHNRLSNTRVSAIVLNWNGAAETRVALRALSSGKTALADIIVVDNGSSEPEASLLAAEFPSAHIIALNENVGFAQGVNIGAIEALKRGSTHFLLLNNDAFLFDVDGLLEKLLSAFSEDPAVAVTGPKIIDASDLRSIQSSGYRYSLRFPLARRIKSGTFDRVARHGVAFLSGSCALFDATIFAKLGGFDPDYFVYCDDVDYALRLKRVGLRSQLVPDATAFHKRATSMGLYSPLYTYRAIRSTLVLIAKHASTSEKLSAYVVVACESAALAALGFPRYGLKSARAAMQAWSDFAAYKWFGFRENRRPGIRPMLVVREPEHCQRRTSANSEAISAVSAKH